MARSPTLRVLVSAFLLLAGCTATALETVDGDAGADGEGTSPSGADAATADPLDAGPEGAVDSDAGSDDAAAPSDAARARDASTLVDCGPPEGLVFTSPQGPFCPFQAGGVFSNCAVGEHCCEYAEDAAIASTCSAGPTACAPAIATGFDWRCDESNDCPGGQVCCFAGEIAPHRQCIGHFRASPDVHGTACRVSACAAGETRTCGSQADCPIGTTCTGMRFRGKHFGFCRPS